MTTASLYAILSVLVTSIISLIGILTLSIRENILRKYIFIFVSLSVGALLGDAFIHLIPEAFSSIDKPLLVSILIIGGILSFFIIEKFIHWHHHGEDTHNETIHPVGKMVLISDGFHNFIDGLIVGASYLVSIEIGIATTIAIILHEIPQEIGDFGVLIHAGYSKKRALWLNFLSAILAVFGVAVTIIIGSIAESLIVWFMPVAAGGFIYIALADIMPTLHSEEKVSHSTLQILAILVGVGAMVLLLLVG